MSDIEKVREHWAKRAGSFEKLEWASRHDYLQSVVHAGELEPTDVVLDGGTGTGLIANAVAPHVAKVIGIDISPEMMDGKTTRGQNCTFQIGDIRAMKFPANYFSKVFARMVFHELIDGVDKAARECHRVVKAGGKFILSEGVPPSRATGDWYTEMFRLKEERLTFFPESLEDLLSRAGFMDIQTRIHISPQVSIRNWLQNSGLGSSRQQKIMQMHLDMPPTIGEAYRATFTDDGDVLVDMKFAIVVGTKK